MTGNVLFWIITSCVTECYNIRSRPMVSDETQNFIVISVPLSWDMIAG